MSAAVDLNGRFRAQAERTPEAVAVVARDRTVTFAELARRSSLLAAALRRAGVGPEERVAVFLSRSAELPAALLGILEAGGAYVPLDPAYPAERLAYMVEDSGARVLVTESALAGRLPAGLAGRRTILADRPDRLGGAAAAGGRPAPAAASDPGPAGRLAYVIYTSGSTGAPKGVGIEHRSVVAFLDWARGVISPEERRRLLGTTSVCFDVSVFEIFLPLCWGGTLVLAGSEFELLAPGSAAEATTISSVPSVAAEVLRQGPLPPSVRTVCLAGEALPRSVADALYAQPGVERVLNLYGPTEDTTYSTWAEVERTGTAPPSIGVAIAGGSARVADERLEAVPDGEVGELFLGGAGLARGYLGRPARTAERFLPDPFDPPSGGLPGGRLYRTGDRARREPDGRLSFLGRLDQQVKIHGLRIELGEVEAALDRLPEVAAGVVLAKELAPGELRLVAYLVPRDPAAVSIEDLRRGMARSLPDFMVPQHFVILDALPKTPSGKVDRRALPDPVREGPRGGAPRTPVEARLATLWADLLGVEGIGPEDDFFGLGGHSLLAARMLFRVEEALGARIALPAFVGARTVGALARLVGDRGDAPEPGAPRAAGLPGIPPAEERRQGRGAALELPLSFAQQRLWLLDRMEPGSPLYNIPRVEHLAGPLDAAALAGALSDLAARHEPLRTTFAERGDRPVQVIAPPRPVALRVIDLAALPPAARRDEAGRLAATGARRPFDLTRGPLLRAVLLSLGPVEHRLLVTVHHIVFDGWSAEVFSEELAECYRARLEDRPPALPPLPIQYGDFAVWQRRWLAGEVLEAELEHWRRELAGAPVILELPADRPRPAVQSFRGGRRSLVLPAAAADAVRSLAARRGATGFMTLTAAFVALLGRWSGQDDLLLGTPAANRRLPELERLIGFFVNTLVLRADLGGDPSFGELVARVRDRAVAAYAHEDLPFERLVEALRPERDRSRNPLVQVVLSVDEETAGRGLGRSEELGTGTAKFDLLVEARLRSEGIRLSAEYRADLFEAATVDRLLAGYRRLLEGALAEPELPVSALPLLGPAERQQVLVEWSRGTSSPLPGTPESPVLTTVGERFDAQARRSPDAVAVVAGAEHLTYRELARRARRLAAELRRRGVGPETPVALALERSAELVVAILGVLEAGGCYLPLDPSDPEERTAFMVADVAAPVVVTTSEREARLPAAIAGARVVLMDRPGRQALRPGPGRVAPGPDGAAYVMYTSGSTGKPKGVVVPHRAVLRLVQGADQSRGFARFAPDETFLQLAPPAFDASTLELWGSLLHGGRLVVAPPGPISPAELGRALEAERVTTLWLTAGLYHQVVEAGLERFAGLRRLLAGGDVLSPEHCRRTLAALPGTVLVNGYGPTENTTFTCCHVMTAAAGVRSPVPLGRPIAGTTVHVVDRHLRPVPPGVPGELVTGGAGLARGYAARPALTAERFVPDPFAAATGSGPGARLYRTGDLARWRPGGELEFLGRLDQQVKIRGFRVEPGEVEAALAGHPAVAEAMVAVREDPAGGKRLVAYVVPADPVSRPARGDREGSAAGGDGLAAELRSYLAGRLPAFMVPAAVVPLDTLPLGPTGKVDRRSLPEPAPAADRDAEPPAAPVEAVIAALWAEVLGLEPGGVARRVGFFDLGGHSLAAARVVARLRDALGVEVPLAALFDAPTVAGFAARVEEELAAGRPVLPPIDRLARAAGPPASRSVAMSFAQERLWFLDRFEPGSPVYNVPVVYALTGALDAPALRSCLRDVVRRHEVLRTTYEAGVGGPRQVVHPEARLGLPVVDLTALPPRAGERAATAAAAVLARRPFDLARGPVLRAALVRLGEREHRLVLVIHHIATDGWSMGVLLDELAAGYPACSGIGAGGGPSPLPEPPVQYADFALWQRRWLQGELLAEQLAYWTERLAGLEPLELPADRPRPAVQSTRGALRTRPLDAGLAAAAEAAGRRQGATLFMTLLAAFAALVARVTGRDDLAFGTPVANRRRSELEGLIGFFVNTLVLRFDLGGDPSFRELLLRVRRAALAAYRHEDLPFERLVEALGVARDLARNPLFQVTFAVHADAGPHALGELEVRSLPVDSGTAKVDLSLTVARGEGRLEAAAEYATALFDATTVERLLRSFASLLRGATGDPDARLSELPLLGVAERHQVLVEWSTRPAQPLPELPVHRLVAAQAGRRADAVAVVDRGRHLSYAELERRAGSLARSLGALGVEPGSLIGLAMERSAERVVVLLGILAAGGAYVPLDTSYPEERLAFLLDDLDLGLVVAEASAVARLPVDSLRTRVVAVEALLGPPAAAPDRARPEPLLPEVDPAAPAYVLFTSGSTGRPKGVAIPHRGIVRVVHEAEFIRFGPGETVLHFSSLSFDASTLEIWGALAHGGRLLVHPPGPISAGELAAHLERERGSAALLTPALLSQLDDGSLARLRGVRSLSSGGDAASPETFRRLLEALPGVAVANAYGPTENSSVTTAYRVRSHLGTAAAVPIGRPIPHTSVHVVDARFREVPIGAPGELVTGGAGLAQGYVGRPGLTAERFVPDPFSPATGGPPGARLYRAGDLVRWRPGGVLEFLGRIDHQVKIRGFRIEPGEIEAALAAHPGVAETLVVARPDPAGGKRLVAFWVAAGEPAPAPSELRAFLAARLPAQLVPSVFVARDSLPLGATGKVERRALSEAELPAEQPAESGGGAGAPGTPIEAALVEIWAEVLGLAPSRVGVHDDFFDLGGHSLAATRVVTRLGTTLGVEVPLRAVFHGPTVAELAARVEELLARDAAAAGGERPPPPPIEPAPRGGVLSLSYNQEQLWFLDQLEPGDPSFNVPFALRFAGALRPAALAAAVTGFARRHESLRTTFAAEAGRPRQVIAPPGRVPLPVADLTGLPEARREAEARRLAAAEGRRGFDLARGPVFRCRLLRLGPLDPVLLWTAHHVTYDGWSHGVLLAELEELYQAAARSRAPALPELWIQYADYASWQRRWLAGDELERRLAFWRARLGGELPVLELPWDRRRPRRRGGRERRGELRSLALEAETLAGLRELGRKAGATLFMTLLAAFDALLHRYSGATDLVVGTPVANRGRGETAGVVGFFVNTLALRADLSGDPPFEELVGRVREVCLEAYAHAEVPFAAVVAAVQPERAALPARATTPLFRVMFSIETAPSPERAGRFADLGVTPFDVHNGTSQFELTLCAVDRGEEVELEVEYDAELLGAAGGEAVLRDLRSLVERVVATPGVRLAELVPSLPSEALAGLEDEPEGLPGEAAAPEPAAPLTRAPAPGPVPGAIDRRRDHLAKRRARLGAAQRAALEARLRGGAEAARAGRAGGSAGSAEPRCLVPLRPGGDGAPLFLVHPAGGDVLCFRGLAAHLAPRRPVYGLQSWGLADGAEPDATIEAMAERYVEEVHRVQRAGPCHLAGWSLGGGLAFEMARRLEAEGAAPGLLAVIDTVPRLADLDLPELDPAAEPDDVRWLLHIVDYAEGLAGRSLGVTGEALRPLAPAAQVARVAGALAGAGLLPAESGERYLERLLAVFKTNCRAAASHRPGRYGGPLVVFRAAGGGTELDAAPGRGADPGPDLGWGRFSGRPVAVEAVPGTHVTLLAEPHVRGLAARLDTWIARLEGAPCAVSEEAS